MTPPPVPVLTKEQRVLAEIAAFDRECDRLNALKKVRAAERRRHVQEMQFIAIETLAKVKLILTETP